MSPFFGYDGGEIFDQSFAAGIAGDQRDTTGGGLLFAPGVIGKDVFQGDRGEIDPARVCRELETEDILVGGSFHGVKLMVFCTFAGNSRHCMNKSYIRMISWILN